MLSNNSITNFDLNLDNLTFLIMLKINDNNITTLQESVFKSYFQHINILNITTNPIGCECSMNWLSNLTTIKTLINLNTDTMCTIDILKDVQLFCFIYQVICYVRINERNCVQGKLITFISLLLLHIVIKVRLIIIFVN